VRSTAKNLNPATALREHENVTRHRAGIATLHGRDRRRNRDRNARLNRTRIRAGIGEGIGPGKGQRIGG